MGTTSNSEDVPCTERELVTGCLREKTLNLQLTAAGKGREWKDKNLFSHPVHPGSPSVQS